MTNYLLLHNIFQAIHSAKQKEILQQMISSDLLLARHGKKFSDEFMHLLIKAADLYEPAGVEKENAFNFLTRIFDCFCIVC